MGVVVGIAGHIPVLGFFVPVYAGLAFIHYGLARLQALRDADAGALAVAAFSTGMPFLFFVQATAEGQQFLEQLVDVPAARVVGLDQFLELRQIVGPRPVQANQLVELRPDRGLELLQVDILGFGLAKTLGQGLEVDLGEINYCMS